MGDVWRRWWPVVAILGVAVLGSVAMVARYSDASGHAAEHLASASAVFLALGLLAVVLWAIPGSWRRPEVWLGALVLLVGLVWVARGNLQVTDALAGTDYDYREAAAFGPLRSGFEAGHETAERGMVVAVLGAVVVIAGATVRRDVSWLTGAVAIVLSVFFPPWILPGSGLAVVAVAASRRHRSRRVTVRAESDARRAPSAQTLAGDGQAVVRVSTRVP